MAEAGSSGLSHNLVCAVCQEVYTDPRFLPCHHTYCARCIQSLAQHHGVPFPCPECRKRISLPAGGAAALQANFFISPEQLRTARDGKLCLSHNQPLSLFCTDCDKLVCVTCLDDLHEDHRAVGLKTAASQARKKGLPEHISRLATAEARVKQQMAAVRRKENNVKEKRAAVKKMISDRHAFVVAAADKYRDEALASLECVISDIVCSNASTLKEQKASVLTLQGLQRQASQAINSDADIDVLLTADDLKHGSGSPQTVNKMTSKQNIVTAYPVHSSSVTSDVVVERVKDFLGSASSVTLEETAAEMRVAEQFTCGKEAGIEVFSLCHVDGEQPEVLVSFQRRGLAVSVPVESFTEKGESLGKARDCGQVTNKRYAEGQSMSPDPQENFIFTFSKSLTAADYQLNNDLSGTASVCRVIITQPFKVEHKVDFIVHVGPHRAFDVDTSEQFFVVLEEARSPDKWRKVHLYQRPKPTPVSTYNPPGACQPSDVCFFRLKGQEYLLVADELNDALHVLHVQEGTLVFVRYLAVACSTVVQPTAVNVDVHGRLWLACRGGKVLCLEPSP